MSENAATQITELPARPHEAAALRYKEIISFCHDNLRSGVHYGNVPGVPKPFLWQPGAQLVAAAWQVVPKYKIASQTEDFQKGIFSYTIQTRLFLIGTGYQVGSGVGSCNSRETKYLSRKNVADLANTILKIAKKRSYVDAVINTFALSEIFTQDPEAVDAECGENADRSHRKTSWRPRVVPEDAFDDSRAEPLRSKFQAACDKAELTGQQRAKMLKHMFTDAGIKTWAGVHSAETAERIANWIDCMILKPAS